MNPVRNLGSLPISSGEINREWKVIKIMKISNGVKNLLKKIDWAKGRNLVPAIVQDANTNMVLMLGYMNKQALKKTLKTKKVWFYSRTKKRLWMKGETSGNYLKLMRILQDCDADVLLIQAMPQGPTCHTGLKSCFGPAPSKLQAFEGLYSLIEDRKLNMPKGSYTTSLFKEGLFKICSKLAEESGEVIKAATKESKRRLIEESVDLVYHLLVLLAEKNIKMNEIYQEIERRRPAG